MVKFVDVDPDEIKNLRTGHRGRVSYPIIKGFLETGKVLVKLDRTGMQQGLQTLNSALNTYIRNHDVPIRVFQRQGEIYLIRTDLDENGVPIDKAHADAPMLDDEVEERFEEEKGQTTK